MRNDHSKADAMAYYNVPFMASTLGGLPLDTSYSLMVQRNPGASMIFPTLLVFARLATLWVNHQHFPNTKRKWANTNLLPFQERLLDPSRKLRQHARFRFRARDLDLGHIPPLSTCSRLTFPKLGHIIGSRRLREGNCWDSVFNRLQEQALDHFDTSWEKEWE